MAKWKVVGKPGSFLILNSHVVKDSACHLAGAEVGSSVAVISNELKSICGISYDELVSRGIVKTISSYKSQFIFLKKGVVPTDFEVISDD